MTLAEIIDDVTTTHSQSVKGKWWWETDLGPIINSLDEPWWAPIQRNKKRRRTTLLGPK